MSTPKVTIRKPAAASEALVEEAVRSVSVTDARGRRIGLSKPNVLAQFRLVKMLGESAQNQAYVMMVFPLLFVTEIDGEPVGFPQTERALEVLISRLDDEGVAAVTTGVQDNWGQSDPEAGKAELKK